MGDLRSVATQLHVIRRMLETLDLKLGLGLSNPASIFTLISELRQTVGAVNTYLGELASALEELPLEEKPEQSDDLPI